MNFARPPICPHSNINQSNQEYKSMIEGPGCNHFPSNLIPQKEIPVDNSWMGQYVHAVNEGIDKRGHNFESSPVYTSSFLRDLNTSKDDPTCNYPQTPYILDTRTTTGTHYRDSRHHNTNRSQAVHTTTYAASPAYGATADSQRGTP